jgi:hypothetical protein
VLRSRAALRGDGIDVHGARITPINSIVRANAYGVAIHAARDEIVLVRSLVAGTAELRRSSTR